MSKINLQVITEQIRSGMYSYDDMVEIVDAIIEAFELNYSEYDSPVDKFIKELKEVIRRWEKEDK